MVKKIPSAGKILAIDYGAKRMGIAISDETQTIAFPVETYQVKGRRKDIYHIKTIIRKNVIQGIVVGFPLNMDGSEGESCGFVLEFVKLLRTKLEIPVEFYDERLTTVRAEQSLLEGDISRGKRKLKKDKVAATLLLQDYMDNRKSLNGTSFPGKI